MPRRKRSAIRIGIAIFLLAGAVAATLAVGVLSGPKLTPAQIAARAAAARARKLLAAETRAVRSGQRALSISLPTHAGAAAPAMPATLYAAPLRAHEVVGFVPYYSLGQITSDDLSNASELCYFGLDLSNSGSITEPTGFVSLSDARFTNFVAAAHGAGDRVLLTLSSQSRKAIDEIARHPDASAARLEPQLVSLVETAHLDGIDLDLEGRWHADRAGFAQFVATFATLFRAADPTGELVVDTYPESASGTNDFFDLRALSPHVDRFFVMAYDMESATNASANSPAASPALGISSVQTLIDYTKIVPRTKIILGLPFYGLDFSTLTNRIGSLVTSTYPEPLTYSAIKAVGRPTYWDPASETPYTRFRVRNQFHETWYDDPLSIALKTALAMDYRVAGVGVWTLGMEGTDTSMLAALSGDATVVKLPIARASATGG